MYIRQKSITFAAKFTTMKRNITLLFALLWAVSMFGLDANLQIFYDFGSLNTACANQRTNRVTTTVELFHPDAWGSTFLFVDFDYSVSSTDPKNTPFGAYWEIARCLNFWKQSKAKDLSLHVEYNGGFGSYMTDQIIGFPINHAALVGAEYFLHTADFKNTFSLELLFKYIADEYNMWQRKVDGKWINQPGNLVPLQFTFVWACNDFCTAPGLTFSGFIDLWGQKMSLFDHKNNTYTDPTKQSFVFLTEPQLWYSIGRWFKCPGLCIGTEIEFSYNFGGAGFMCNPCLGIKWKFL